MNQADIAMRWREALAGEEHIPFDVMERYVDRQLNDGQRGDVDSHLAGCALCTDEMEDLQSFAGSLLDCRRALRRRRTFLYSSAAFAAAAMLIVVIGIDRMKSAAPVPVPTLSSTMRSMAVLPLRNITKSASDEFLSVAIADALITRLESRSDVAVRPMTSILPIRHETSDVRKVAQKLNVEGVLEGQYDASADYVRVTMQLTDPRTGRAMWLESVDGPRGDLLKLVDDVTARTESRLNGHGRAVERPLRSEPRSSNPKAYESYLMARSLYGSFRETDYENHIASLERAIALDPGFAAAHADLALALTIGVVRSLATDSDVIDRAEAHAHEAVRLDPSLSQAHLALGRVLARRTGRFREAVREIVASLRLNPGNISGLQAMVSYFAYSGDGDRMHCIGERIVRIDPLSDEARTRGYWFNKTLESDLALRSADYALAHPTSALAGHDIRGEAFVYQGNLAAAEAEATAALKLDPARYHGKSLMAMVAAARGNRAEAQRWLAQFEDEANRNHFAAVRRALCHAKLGDRDATLHWIGRAITLGSHAWYFFTKHPWLATLQNDPGFLAHLAGIKADLEAVHRDVMNVYPLITDDSCLPHPVHPTEMPGSRASLSGVRAAP